MPTSLQLLSNIKSSGELEFSMVEAEVPSPQAGEILVKMEAAPINPSDMWPMFGVADLSQAQLDDSGDLPVLRAPVPGHLLPFIKSRLDQALPVGNEGAGTVIEAGEGAEGLVGKTVAVMSGAAYSQYCCIPMHSCMPMNDGTTAKQAASSFVNPLTALGMVDTMRMEGHTALVHTAAASNLGQMLNKICNDDDVQLVNIVRKQEQVDILNSIGAKIVVNSSSDTYQQDLYQAIAQTGATVAFDATGGGRLASDILATMEAFLSKDAVGLNTYGSEAHKQVYLYGGLDPSATTLQRAYGMSWGVGGWLLPRFLAKAGMERAIELRQRVADEITTTFASNFTSEIGLKDVLNPDHIAEYNAKRTGEKYLVKPNS